MTEYTHFVNLYFFQTIECLIFEFLDFLIGEKHLKFFIYEYYM
jgi:hypothetical protein